MSLALPYPSMVFVPLDVLTADEMNHIVSNYEYIASQFPITSDNIDSTTLLRIPTQYVILCNSTNGIKISFSSTSQNRLSMLIMCTDNNFGTSLCMLSVNFNSAFDLSSQKIEAIIGTAPAIVKDGNSIKIRSATAWANFQIFCPRTGWLTMNLSQATD